MARAPFQRLADGEYIAKCKDTTAAMAVLNGHYHVWPESYVVVKNGFASFFKDDIKVWECNARYAHRNFDCSPAPILDSISETQPSA